MAAEREKKFEDTELEKEIERMLDDEKGSGK